MQVTTKLVTPNLWPPSQNTVLGKLPTTTKKLLKKLVFGTPPPKKHGTNSYLFLQMEEQTPNCACYFYGMEMAIQEVTPISSLAGFQRTQWARSHIPAPRRPNLPAKSAQAKPQRRVSARAAKAKAKPAAKPKAESNKRAKAS